MADSKYGTSFTESEALLSVINEDTDNAQRLISDMLPHERRALIKACDELSSMLWIRNRDG